MTTLMKEQKSNEMFTTSENNILQAFFMFAGKREERKRSHNQLFFIIDNITKAARGPGSGSGGEEWQDVTVIHIFSQKMRNSKE